MWEALCHRTPHRPSWQTWRRLCNTILSSPVYDVINAYISAPISSNLLCARPLKPLLLYQNIFALCRKFWKWRLIYKCAVSVLYQYISLNEMRALRPSENCYSSPILSNSYASSFENVSHYSVFNQKEPIHYLVDYTVLFWHLISLHFICQHPQLKDIGTDESCFRVHYGEISVAYVFTFT